MNRLRMLAVALAVLTLGTSSATCQTWQPLTNQPSFSPGAVLLLTDGTVLAHSEPNCLNCTSTDYNSWYKLTPDSSGSYVHGAWTQVASPTGYAPLYFGSVVLPNGHVVVEGGEYDCSSGTCNAAWTNQGAIYDPVKNGWTSVAPPTGWKTIGDAQSVILPNGTYMQADCCTKDGTAAGLLLGLLASRVLALVVCQATPRDPMVLAGAVLAMALMGLLATSIPTRRALSVDPMILLREE